MQVNGTVTKMNDTRTVKLVCEFEYSTVGRRNVARPRKRWTNTLKSKQSWIGLYLTAAADDDDFNVTALSYVTDWSVLSLLPNTSWHNQHRALLQCEQHLRRQQQSARHLTNYINWMGPPACSLSAYGSGIVCVRPWQCCVVPSDLQLSLSRGLSVS